MAMDAEKIAKLTDQELGALSSNIARLGSSGTAPQRAEAERLSPLVTAETQKRSTEKSAVRAANLAARRAKPKAKEEPKA
jgi:hypothetical protein